MDTACHRLRWWFLDLKFILVSCQIRNFAIQVCQLCFFGTFLWQPLMILLQKLECQNYIQLSQFLMDFQNLKFVGTLRPVRNIQHWKILIFMFHKFLVTISKNIFGENFRVSWCRLVLSINGTLWKKTLKTKLAENLVSYKSLELEKLRNPNRLGCGRDFSHQTFLMRSSIRN